MLQLDPFGQEFLGEPGGRCSCASYRVHNEHLRANVQMETHELKPVTCRYLSADGESLVERHAELVRPATSRNIRVADGINIGIHPERDTGTPAVGAGQSIDTLELARRLRIDSVDAQGHGPLKLRLGLPNTSENDVAGLEPGAKCNCDLPARIGVDAAAEALDQPCNR